MSLLSEVPGMNICIQTEATNFVFTSLEVQFVMCLRVELYVEAPVIFSLEKNMREGLCRLRAQNK